MLSCSTLIVIVLSMYIPGWDGHPDININVSPMLMLICATIIVTVLSICIYLDGIVAQILVLMFRPTSMPNCATIIMVVLSICMYLDGMVCLFV